MNIEIVIERLQRGARKDIAGRAFPPATGIDAATLDALRLPGGEPIPHELRTWLAFDKNWFGLVDEHDALRCERLRDTLARWAQRPSDDDEPISGEDVSAGDLVGYWIEGLPERSLADAYAIEVRYSPGSQEHILIVDPERVRVLGSHKSIEFWWKYSSLAELVAHWFGFIEKD